VTPEPAAVPEGQNFARLEALPANSCGKRNAADVTDSGPAEGFNNEAENDGQDSTKDPQRRQTSPEADWAYPEGSPAPREPRGELVGESCNGGWE
jgi:hypothetical protein